MNVSTTPIKTRNSNIFIRCPHCEDKACVRDSRQESRIVRYMLCQCTNVFCGHTFVAHLEAVRTIAPSATPHAEVQLPMSHAAILRGQQGTLSKYKGPARQTLQDVPR